EEGGRVGEARGLPADLLLAPPPQHDEDHDGDQRDYDERDAEREASRDGAVLALGPDEGGGNEEGDRDQPRDRGDGAKCRRLHDGSDLALEQGDRALEHGACLRCADQRRHAVPNRKPSPTAKVMVVSGWSRSESSSASPMVSLTSLKASRLRSPASAISMFPRFSRSCRTRFLASPTASLPVSLTRPVTCWARRARSSRRLCMSRWISSIVVAASLVDAMARSGNSRTVCSLDQRAPWNKV